MHGRGGVIAQPNPAVATGFTYNVPGTVEAEVLAVSFLLTNDANAGNRLPFLRILDETGTTVARVAAPFTLAATLASQFTFAVGINQYGANDAAAIGAPIPCLRLTEGQSVNVGITTVKAGDQVSAVRLYVVQYPTRPPELAADEWADFGVPVA